MINLLKTCNNLGEFANGRVMRRNFTSTSESLTFKFDLCGYVLKLTMKKKTLRKVNAKELKN